MGLKQLTFEDHKQRILTKLKENRAPLLGYGKNHVEALDRNRGQENNAVEREGGKHTKLFMEREKQKFFSVIFGGTRTLYNKVLPSKTGKCTKIMEECMMVSSVW